MIKINKQPTLGAAAPKNKTRREVPAADRFSRSQPADTACPTAQQMLKAATSPGEFTKAGYTAIELRNQFCELSSNTHGRYGGLDTEQGPRYFQAVLDSLKPGEPLDGPVNLMLHLVNRFMFSQDQVVPAYQLIDKYAVSPNDRLKLADKFFATLSDVEKHSPSPGMTYDSRPTAAQARFAQEMAPGHQEAGYSQAELKSESNRLGGNWQGRYGSLDSEQESLYFGTVANSLKPGEPIAGAVDGMLRIVNKMMFTQDQVVPIYNLIDKYATSPHERLKLTDKFFATLAKVQASTPEPGMRYDTRPALAQKQFEKELAK